MIDPRTEEHDRENVVTTLIGGLFDYSDKVQIATLQHREQKASVIKSNIANAETPGYRALGYDFETQLQSIVKRDHSGGDMRVSDLRHLRSPGVMNTGNIEPQIFVRPTESIGQDGNSVELDEEMAKMRETVD